MKVIQALIWRTSSFFLFLFFDVWISSSTLGPFSRSVNHIFFSLSQAYELSTLTGTQVLLLVASETGHVYTFATRKLQPMITSETGKALIQTCLNSPDSPPRSDPSTDQRMSATGFEETDLTYQVSESESMGDTKVSIIKWKRLQAGPPAGQDKKYKHLINNKTRCLVSKEQRSTINNLRSLLYLSPQLISPAFRY